MIQASGVNEWGATQLAPSTPTNPWGGGGSLVPAQNTMGDYHALAVAAEDSYEIDLIANDVDIATVARDCLITIGIDRSGGTSYIDWIENLLASCAGGPSTPMGVGVIYRFPLFIPAGSRLAAKCQVSSADVTAIGLAVVLRQRPSRPDLIRAGTFVRSFGATPASSSGTPVTPANGSKGSYVQLGSALAEPLWAWEFGYGVSDTTMGNGTTLVDVAVGDATTKKLCVADGIVAYSIAEAVNKQRGLAYRQAAIGDLVYGRMLCSTAPDTNISMMAYGVGG